MAKDELKTIKFQMMLSESEARAIDDWGFAHRIRSRAEAIRRLCQLSLIFDDRAEGMLEQADQFKSFALEPGKTNEAIEMAIEMAGDVQMLGKARSIFADGEKAIPMDRIEEVRQQLKAGRARRVEAIENIKRGGSS